MGAVLVTDFWLLDLIKKVTPPLYIRTWTIFSQASKMYILMVVLAPKTCSKNYKRDTVLAYAHRARAFDFKPRAFFIENFKSWPNLEDVHQFAFLPLVSTNFPLFSFSPHGMHPLQKGEERNYGMYAAAAAGVLAAVIAAVIVMKLMTWTKIVKLFSLSQANCADLIVQCCVASIVSRLQC